MLLQPRPSSPHLSKVVLTACARKLLTILNAMARSNTYWQAPVVRSA
jgi:hypothetical protein